MFFSSVWSITQFPFACCLEHVWLFGLMVMDSLTSLSQCFLFTYLRGILKHHIFLITCLNTCKSLDLYSLVLNIVKNLDYEMHTANM